MLHHMGCQSSSINSSSLLEPTQFGALKLKNRFVVAPLARLRADPSDGIPNDLMAEYYSQRASFGLVITEGSVIHEECNSYPATGCIYNEAQAKGWKKVTDAVHSKNGLIVLQICHLGRVAKTSESKGKIPVSASTVPISSKDNEYAVPHELTISEIKEIIEEFRKSAVLAKQAGFDGVELHGANGFLVDQFLRDGTNKRTDKYGGSYENRSRFCLEVLQALISVFGNDRVAIRLSPTGRVNDMYDSNPLELMKYLLTQLSPLNLAFVELKRHGNLEKMFPKVEGRVDPIIQIPNFFEQLRPFYKGNLIANDGVSIEEAQKLTKSSTAQAVSFGTLSISNPDLPYRVEHNIEINQAKNMETWFTGGAKGYIDYPFAEKVKS